MKMLKRLLPLITALLVFNFGAPVAVQVVGHVAGFDVSCSAIDSCAEAAIAFNANSGAAGNDTTPTVSHTAAGSDRFVYICIYAAGDTTISSISYGAQTPTLIERKNLGGGSSNTLWTFQLINPNTGAQTVSATMAAGSLWGIGVSSYTGVHQTTAIGTNVSAEFNAAATVTVDATSASGELVVDCTCGGMASMTVGAGQTERLNSDFATNLGFRKLGMSEEAGGATVTMSWSLTSASGRSGILAVPLKPSAGGGASAAPLFHYYRQQIGLLEMDPAEFADQPVDSIVPSLAEALLLTHEYLRNAQ